MLMLCIATTLIAAMLAYACSPHQRWLAKSLAARWQWLAPLLAALSLILWVVQAGVLVGFFVTLTLFMLLFGLLPLTPLLRKAGEQ